MVVNMTRRRVVQPFISKKIRMLGKLAGKSVVSADKFFVTCVRIAAQSCHVTLAVKHRANT